MYPFWCFLSSLLLSLHCSTFNCPYIRRQKSYLFAFLLSSRVEGEELPEIRIETASPAGPRVTFNIQDSVSIMVKLEWPISPESELVLLFVGRLQIKVIRYFPILYILLIKITPSLPQPFFNNSEVLLSSSHHLFDTKVYYTDILDDTAPFKQRTPPPRQ